MPARAREVLAQPFTRLLELTPEPRAPLATAVPRRIARPAALTHEKRSRRCRERENEETPGHAGIVGADCKFPCRWASLIYGGALTGPA